MLTKYSVLSLVDYHKKRTGRDYDINNPTSFNEKILWRKLNDRRPILSELTDKANIKKLFPRYAIPNHIEGYPLVVRPNNYSGKTQIIKNKTQWFDFIRWWNKNKHIPYGQRKGEWAYKNIEPQLLIEPVIEDFWELKAYVFGGEVKCFYICGQGEGRPEQNGVSYFWPDGEPIDIIHNGKPNPYNEVPFESDEALEVAESLTDLDFVRVDLMITDQIYLTEFTFYPGSGCIDFCPESFDYELGEFWNLPCL